VRFAALVLVPASVFLFSCAGGPSVAPEVLLDPAKSPQQLRELLESFRERADVEAMMGRARIYNRLRELERTVSPTLLALGDASDVDVLSHGGTAKAKAESAARLAAHFRERAENPVLSRSSFPATWGADAPDRAADDRRVLRRGRVAPGDGCPSRSWPRRRWNSRSGRRSRPMQ
jgi:hypothetical protein